MKFKKIFSLIGLTLVIGSAVSVAAVACKKTESTYHYKIVPTYVSQADNLIALGIIPDYYPKQLQWNHNKPYDFMNPEKVEQYVLNKKEFGAKLKNKLSNIFSNVKEYGQSWWSFSGNALGEGTSEEYWDKRKGSFVLYDRYLIDNSHFENAEKKLKAEGGPIFNSNTAYPVDFKMSRDIYLNISKEDILSLDNPKTKLQKELNAGLDYKDKSTHEFHPLHNFSYFANKIKTNFLEAKQKVGFDFENSNFAKLIIDGNDTPIFYVEKNWKDENSLNSKLYKVFKKIVLTPEVKNNHLNQMNYNPLSNNKTESYTSELQHHPVYEQNLRLDGGTQTYLGSIRDSLLYLYDIAFSTVMYANTEEAKKVFENEPERLELMKNALINANEIAGNLINRIKVIRNLFKKLKVVDENYDPESKNFDNTNSISLGLLASASGNGATSSLQSQSKYGFLYYDLGFKAPKPKLLTDDPDELLTTKAKNEHDANCHSHDGEEGYHCHGDPEGRKVENSIFNMDDNGWWWNLGEGVIEQTNFARFYDSLDLVINVEFENKQKFQTQNAKTQIKNLLKEDKREKSSAISFANYELWHEGARSPIGYNQVLDSLIQIILRNVDKSLVDQYKQEINEAFSWGSYWDKFVK